MKTYKLHVRLQGCGPKLLKEIEEDLEKAQSEINYTNDLSDGGSVKCTGKIEIIGKDVILDAEFEGHGSEYMDRMEDTKKQVLSGEFQRSCKNDWDRFPDQSCQKVIATVEVL